MLPISGLRQIPGVVEKVISEALLDYGLKFTKLLDIWFCWRACLARSPLADDCPATVAHRAGRLRHYHITIPQCTVLT